MDSSLRLSFRKGDWLAIGIVAALALTVALLFVPGNGKNQEAVIQVYQNNVLVKECPLEIEEIFTITGDYNNTIVISEGKAAIAESDCPGADCVHSGAIGTVGRSIVCLPNKVEIRVAGQTEAEVDFVVR